MNAFFLGKVAGRREGIPESNTDPMVNFREPMRDRQCSFSLGAVYPDDVLKIIKALKNSKSTGTDNIDTFIIKLVADDIVAPLTHIYS